MNGEKIFPWEYSEVELRKRIYESRDKFGKVDPHSPQRPELQADIELGLSELQRRNGEAALEVSVQSARSANKLFKLAIGISITAIVITLVLAFTDRNWQEEQLRTLKETRDTIATSVNKR